MVLKEYFSLGGCAGPVKCQNMSSCQKDVKLSNYVKCQKIKHLDCEGGSQKNN